MGTLLPFRLLPGDEADLPKRRLKNPHRQAEESLNEIVSLLQSGAKAVFRPLKLKEELAPAFSKEEYGAMVEKARHYIHEGDIFQVVLSNPMTAAAEGSLFDTYRVLRAVWKRLCAICGRIREIHEKRDSVKKENRL